MSISPILLALSGTFLGLGTPPVTHAAAGAAFVDASPVSDALLGQSHGTGSGITLRSLRTLATQRSRRSSSALSPSTRRPMAYCAVSKRWL